MASYADDPQTERERLEHIRAVAVGADHLPPAEAHEAELTRADLERDLEREELEVDDDD